MSTINEKLACLINTCPVVGFIKTSGRNIKIVEKVGECTFNFDLHVLEGFGLDLLHDTGDVDLVPSGHGGKNKTQ